MFIFISEVLRKKQIFRLVMCFSLLAGCAQKPLTPEVRNSHQRAAFGLKFSDAVVPFSEPLSNGANSGLKMEVIFPYFPAAKAGIQSGDVLVGFNQEVFKNLSKGSASEWTRRLSELPLGSHVQFIVFQPKTQKLRIFDLPVVVRNWSYGDQPIPNDESWPQLPSNHSIEKRTILEVTRNQKEADLEDLKKRITQLAVARDPQRLPIVSYLQKNPFEIEGFQNLLLKRAQNCQKNPDVFDCLRGLLDSARPSPLIKVKHFELDTRGPNPFLQSVERIIKEGDRLLNEAFSELTSEELGFMKTHAKAMASRFTENLYLHEDSDTNRLEADLKLMQLIQKVKVEKFVESLLVYESLSSPQSLQKLKHFGKEFRNSKEETLAVLRTEEGTFIFGGPNDNDYSRWSRENVLFIFDIGGNDRYSNISASLVDLSGNDVYQSEEPWTLNSGFFRTRVLVDLAGQDEFQCSMGCLASSFFGASLLFDMEGNDLYRTKAFSIGSSLIGISLFYDGSGNDKYESSLFSQGVGIAGGFGLMFDGKGDDQYRILGEKPSSYGDVGQFEGFSQGVGVGFRNFVLGGWGLLYDGADRDQYDSGTFSQGGGYYFGLGSLIDDGVEDDEYQGARYSQGFSAHSAIGTFLNVGGSDKYQTRSFVGQGMAWDLSVTLFEDRAGNDLYKTCEHCLGVGSQNSFAFFVDREGQDRYLGLDLPYGQKRYNDYHGGKSLGLFWDLGDQVDVYEKFKNKTDLFAEGWQILIDE